MRRRLGPRHVPCTTSSARSSSATSSSDGSLPVMRLKALTAPCVQIPCHQSHTCSVGMADGAVVGPLTFLMKWPKAPTLPGRLLEVLTLWGW